MITTTLILLFSLFLPQQVRDTLYVESWKKGKEQITEQNFDVELNRAKPKFEVKIKDAAQKEKYKLTLLLREGRDKAQPPYGYVELVEKGLLGFKETNLLKPSDDPYQDYFTGEDYVAVLDPAMKGERCSPSEGCAPFFARRVVRVKGFYCVVRVVKYNESPASMFVRIELTNEMDGLLTRPRT